MEYFEEVGCLLHRARLSRRLQVSTLLVVMVGMPVVFSLVMSRVVDRGHIGCARDHCQPLCQLLRLAKE
jgi:hypothetical protein